MKEREKVKGEERYRRERDGESFFCSIRVE